VEIKWGNSINEENQEEKENNFFPSTKHKEQLRVITTNSKLRENFQA
jgi:hypothetical protein